MRLLSVKLPSEGNSLCSLYEDIGIVVVTATDMCILSQIEGEVRVKCRKSHERHYFTAYTPVVIRGKVMYYCDGGQVGMWEVGELV